MKKMKIAKDPANLTKVDFQADADVGVLTYPELMVIAKIIKDVEENWDTAAEIESCNPDSDQILEIRIKRSCVDPYFDSLWLALTRRWTAGRQCEGSVWTVHQVEDMF